MTTGRYNRTALVLSGGGARAAYEAGVLKALTETLRQPAPFSMYCGASGGALNAAWLALADDFAAGVQSLANFWSGMRVERAYRAGARRLPAWWPSRSGDAELLDNSPLGRTLSESIDFGRLRPAVDRQALRALCITCSGYGSGQSVSFFQGRADLEPWQGAQRVGAHVRLEAIHLVASMALPFTFPAVRLHREYFGDGGLRQTAPLAPAVRLGADRILAIGPGATTVGQGGRGGRDGDGGRNGDGAERPRIDRHPSRADVIGHMLAGSRADAFSADVERMVQVNRLLAAGGPVTLDRAPSPWRPIEVLAIEPSEPLEERVPEFLPRLSGEVRRCLRRLGAEGEAGAVLASHLLFEGSYARHLIDLGYRDGMARWAEMSDFFAQEPR